jgi:hypothetical protein
MGLGRFAGAVFFGGLLAGSFDIAAASLIYGVTPIVVLQSIASGLIGHAAFHGGLHAAAIGVACHYLIAFVCAALYVVASRAMPFLIRQAILCGLVYGIAIYVVMNYVVIPLSLAHRVPFAWSSFVLGLLANMIAFALPIALCAKWFAGPRRVFG